MEKYRKLLGSKIHNATVTHADLHYEGSITLPRDILAAAQLLPYEAVQIWNVTSGARLETYIIEGAIGSADICINGAAAHLVKPGDLIIVAQFVYVAEPDCKDFRPRIIFLDQANRIESMRNEIAGPALSPQAV
jgi:aspartate 1-decarboxylase